MTWYLLCVSVCVCVCTSVYNWSCSCTSCCTQLCCTDPSAVCNSVFIIFSLYMIILVLINNIHCIFGIIYMHYHMSNHSLTELFWWFWFVVFTELFHCTIPGCYAVQLWLIWNVCLVWNPSQKCLYSPNQQHFMWGAAFVVVLCSYRIMKAGHLQQYTVYGDGSLYSCRNILLKYKTLFQMYFFSVFLTMYGKPMYVVLNKCFLSDY